MTKANTEIPDSHQGTRFVPGPITLYAQLASVLRGRIISGEWPDGEAIPSIQELCETYSLGRITVRQALQILANEGLVYSQRGRRTIVTHSEQRGIQPLFLSVADIDAEVADYSIRILSRSRVDELPAARWAIGASAGPYQLIRKIDHEGNRPYALSTLYIVDSLYRRFPKGAEERSKLARLATQYAKPRITSARERLVVGNATMEEATQLDCPLASPMARAERVFCDTNGNVMLYGTTTYRGDRFGLERDLSDYLN